MIELPYQISSTVNSIFSEELEAIQAIFPDQLHTLSSSAAYLQMYFTCKIHSQVTAKLFFIATSNYPEEIPIVLLSMPMIPPNQCKLVLKRSYLKNLNTNNSRILGKTQELQGSQMIYDVTLWLQQSFAELINSNTETAETTETPATILNAPVPPTYEAPTVAQSKNIHIECARRPFWKVPPQLPPRYKDSNLPVCQYAFPILQAVSSHQVIGSFFWY